jgi:hypothetical protein
VFRVFKEARKVNTDALKANPCPIRFLIRLFSNNSTGILLEIIRFRPS